MTPRKFQPKPVPAAITALMVAVLLALGFWQLERMEWKEELLARIDSQMAAKPQPLPEAIEKPEEWEFRRVSVAGQYLYDREFLVGPRTLDGKNGFHMVVPFRRASGGVVLVNRGWITEELRKKADRPEGLVLVEGFLQVPKHNRFTPDNVPDKKQWYWIDTKAMAEAAKIDSVAGAIIVTPESPKGVYPAGGALNLDIPNDHRKYAYFWFSMALAAIVIFVLSGLQPGNKLEEKNAGV